MAPMMTSAYREYLRFYSRTAGLLVAMGAGALVPGAHVLSGFIPVLVAAMLFLSSIDLRVGRGSFGKTVWRILAANLVIAFLAFFALLPVDRTLALAAFLTGVTPTAISAPVITGFLEGEVECVVASVLVTNLFMAFMLPFVLPLVAGTGAGISVTEALRSVLLVVCLPLFLARGVSYLPPGARRAAAAARPLSYPVWLVVLFIVTATSSAFLRSDTHVSPGTLTAIAGISLVICAVNFSVGALLGGTGRRRESSQSLGQKNNSFTIWIALAFLSPVVALGPTCYVLYHNAYNALQIIAFERRRKRGNI